MTGDSLGAVRDPLGGVSEATESLVHEPITPQLLRKNLSVVSPPAGLAVLLGSPRAGVDAAVLLAVMAGASAVAEPFRSGLQAIEHLEVAAAISIANAIVSAVGIVVLVEAGYGLVGAIAFS